MKNKYRSFFRSIDEPAGPLQKGDFASGIGPAIKAIREIKGLTQKDLADMAMCSVCFIKSVEEGTARSKDVMEFVKDLAPVIGLSFSIITLYALGLSELPEEVFDEKERKNFDLIFEKVKSFIKNEAKDNLLPLSGA